MANTSGALAFSKRLLWTKWIGHAACAWALLSGINHAYQNFAVVFHANAGDIVVMAIPSLLFWVGAFTALALVSSWGRHMPGLLLLTLAWGFAALFTYLGIYPLMQVVTGRGSLLLFGF